MIERTSSTGSYKLQYTSEGIYDNFQIHKGQLLSRRKKTAISATRNRPGSTRQNCSKREGCLVFCAVFLLFGFLLKYNA